MVFNISRY